MCIRDRDLTMYLYNSATHKKEEFKTHTPGHVEMYTCGPTVYHLSLIHI